MSEKDIREINVKVAAEVMGWTQWADLSGDAPEDVTCFADWGDTNGVAVYAKDDATGDVAFYFNPAEDIADAWRLVEKFDWLAPAVYRGHSFNWGCRMGDAHGEGDTVQLAICHAALSVAPAPEKRCHFPWCGVEKLCVDCAASAK